MDGAVLGSLYVVANHVVYNCLVHPTASAASFRCYDSLQCS